MLDAGYQISYTEPNGEVWVIHTANGRENRQRRIALAEGGWGGGVADPEFQRSLRPGGFGERVTSRGKLPAMEGSAELYVLDKVNPVHSQRNFRGGWSHDQDGKWTVVARDGGNFWTPARLVSLSVPGAEPDRRSVESRKFTVDWVGLDGCWYGPQVVKEGAFDLSVPGQFPPLLFLRWAGEATSVTFPQGLTVNLNALREDGQVTPWTRLIDLNFGMSGRMTVEANGRVDSVGWSGLLGAVQSVTLRPHEVSSWVLGPGLELLVTPRFSSPWR